MKNPPRVLYYASCLLAGLVLTGIASCVAQFLRHTDFATIDALFNRRGVINRIAWWSGLSVLCMIVMAHMLRDFRTRLTIAFLTLSVSPLLLGLLGYRLGLEDPNVYRNPSVIVAGDNAAVDCTFVGGLLTFLCLFAAFLLWVRRLVAGGDVWPRPDEHAARRAAAAIGWAWIVLGCGFLLVGLGSLPYSTSVSDWVESVLASVFGGVGLVAAFGFFKRKRWSYRVLRVQSWGLLLIVAGGFMGAMVAVAVVLATSFLSGCVDYLSFRDNGGALLIFAGAFVFFVALYIVLPVLLVRAIEGVRVRALFRGKASGTQFSRQ